MGKMTSILTRETVFRDQNQNIQIGSTIVVDVETLVNDVHIYTFIKEAKPEWKKNKIQVLSELSYDPRSE